MDDRPRTVDVAQEEVQCLRSPSHPAVMWAQSFAVTMRGARSSGKICGSSRSVTLKVTPSARSSCTTAWSRERKPFRAKRDKSSDGVAVGRARLPLAEGFVVAGPGVLGQEFVSAGWGRLGDTVRGLGGEKVNDVGQTPPPP